MTDKKMSQEEVSRRTLLKSVPAIAAIALPAAAALPEVAAAQEKLSHEAAKYQDDPKGGQQCSTCLQFEPPSSCKIVASPISPHGWCQFYAPKT